MRQIRTSCIPDASVLHTRLLPLIDAKEVFVVRLYTPDKGLVGYIGTALVCGVLVSDVRKTIEDILEVVTDYFDIASEVPDYMAGTS